MLLVIISQLIGFCREVILAHYYGTSNVSDAYLIAIMIPGIVIGFIASAVAATYIPIYTALNIQNTEEEGNRFTVKLLILLAVVSFFVFFIIFYNIENVVYFFSPGFESFTHNLTVNLTKGTVIGVFFLSLTPLFTGFLQVNGKFIKIALIGIPFSLVNLISIYLSVDSGLQVLSTGYVIALAFQFSLLLLLSYKNNLFLFKGKVLKSFFDVHVKKMILMCLPVIVGVSFNQINVIVDRGIASDILEGGVSIINFANRINGIVEAVFITVIISVFYPAISKLHANSDSIGFAMAIKNGLYIIVIIITPISVGVLFYSFEIIDFIFGHGVFGSDSVNYTSSVLFYYSIGMVFFGVTALLTKVFYSFSDTKTPMLIASVGIGVNILLNIYLSKLIGIHGLAIATSSSMIITSIIMYMVIKVKVGDILSLRDGVHFIKYVFVSFIAFYIVANIDMYLADIFLFQLFDFIRLPMNLLIGMILYLLILFIIKDQGFKKVYSDIGERVSK